MNNEIKEILDNFKIYEDRYKKCNETQFIIFYRDIHLLLDYITNLQQENERLKEILHNIITTDGETTTPVLDLIEEIEELKADLNEANDSVAWWKNRYNAVERNNKEYN